MIQTVLDGINANKDSIKIRVVSLASDGESRRGKAFVLHTFKFQLSDKSPIHPLLSPLPLMDLHVGIDDLTPDKDWKHVIKRARNLSLRACGIVVNGFRITPDIIKEHLRSEAFSADHIHTLFNPNDQQDVKAAFDMLKDIWTLPRETSNKRPGFSAAREALWTLGKFFYHLVFPYLCVDLSLSEQLEHLSAAAHLALTLYKNGGKTFLPTELFIDVMLMIKNTYFCVAKVMADNPDGCCWIILLGTDRLEELFGILRTMVGTDTNLDFDQLVSRLGMTTEVSNILAKYPQWDKSPRRLKIPAITRESKELPDGADHIKPGSWRGDVHVKNVSLQTAWKRGRRVIETECGFSIAILAAIDQIVSASILAPHGVLLVGQPLDPDDIDESLDDASMDNGGTAPNPTTEEEAASSVDNRLEVEDMLAEHAASSRESDSAEPLVSTRAFGRFISVNGKEVVKSRALAQYSKYRKFVSSTDRLRRVQAVGRYVSAYSSSSKCLSTLSKSTPDTPVLVVSDPIVSLLICDNRAWLSFGEVNGLKIDGDSVEFIPHEILGEATVAISYQLLGLRPATSDDDPTSKHDWRSCRTEREQSFTVAGSLVQPINPDLPQDIGVGIGYYLLDSQVLVALTASLLEKFTAADLKNVPKLAPTKDFPYRERAGKCCSCKLSSLSKFE